MPLSRRALPGIVQILCAQIWMLHISGRRSGTGKRQRSTSTSFVFSLHRMIVTEDALGDRIRLLAPRGEICLQKADLQRIYGNSFWLPGA